MPFTDRELVKKHLVDFRVGQAEVKGFSVVLTGTDAVQLPHSGLVEASVVLKAGESSTPTMESKTLVDDWVSLSQADLVPGSVLVANNTSVSTIYAENLDYTVDYTTGRLRRIDGGSVTSGSTVSIWYFYYRRYDSGDDYVVNVVAGQVRRAVGGVIEDGQTVLIDYTAGFGAVTEEAIDQAISEADEIVLRTVDQQYHDAIAPGLVAAETHQAVAILCRVRAAAILTGSTATSAAAAVAKAWLLLSEQYTDSATRLLQPFRRAVPSQRNLAFVRHRPA